MRFNKASSEITVCRLKIESAYIAFQPSECSEPPFLRLPRYNVVTFEMSMFLEALASLGES